MDTFLACILLATALASYARLSLAAEETITGTIYCNNNGTLYVNGRLVARDPIEVAPHNAYNVSFEVDTSEDITFAIDAIDIADDETGLELNDRCLGAGGLRAMFSNGVVTNSSWKCYTWHYGPVNWKQCFAAEGRDGPLKVFPACLFNVSEDDGFDSGCFSRMLSVPEGWADPDFDDSRWEYATEWDDDYVRPFVWPAFPPGCTDPETVVSTLQVDGVNVTCPSNVDWGDAKFIWRPDIDLDNRILCRYTLKVTGGAQNLLTSLSATVLMMLSIATTLLTM